MIVDIEPLLAKCKEIYNSRTPFAATLIIREMEKAKSVDVEEVKHGEWIAKPSAHISKKGRVIHYDRYKCSVCGVWNGRHKPNYCPKCGAKMDGVNYESSKECT